MRSRTVEILGNRVTMVHTDNNYRCLPITIFSLTIEKSIANSGCYNIVYNGHGIILSCIESIMEAESALAELKALFFVE
jgi:hypothetical protein